MYPSIVAAQMRHTLLDYLKTTFSFSDPEFDEAFFDFLGGDQGIIKGPFLDIKLPFRKSLNTTHQLEITPPFQPFEHQRRSFGRLHSRAGHQPQPTLVVTGTGSGKTECFLYPILDHCFRTRNEPGVKAILLYPMNALATDQARRLAGILANDKRLNGKVTAGLYVGGAGEHPTATSEHLVDDRTVLRKNPPNILLTNYKMLDFLLQRPEDRPLWNKNTPDTLSYLVLDELHTYDGAQGSDVACLIRRLKARLQVPLGGLCCVGTSATIGADTNRAAEQPLVEFARKVFDEPNFNEDSIVPENRQTIEEALKTSNEDTDFSTDPEDHTLDVSIVRDMDPENPKYREGVETYLAKQAKLWLDLDDADPIKLTEKLKTDPLLYSLLTVMRGRLQPISKVCDGLARSHPFFRDLDPKQREIALNSYVSLISHARVQEGKRISPFLTCHVHFWFREIRRLLRKVSEGIEFFWSEDAPKESSVHGLPLAYCRECGADGVGTVEKEAMNCFLSAPSVIGEAFLKERKTARFVRLNHHREDGGLPTFLNVKSLHHYPANEGDPGDIPIAVTTASRKDGGSETKVFLGECPSCGTAGNLSLLGSRAATLSSVAISLLFNTPYNLDKKLLAFTDSVQDASHRAGFFGARTYRFHLRTQIQRAVDESGGTLPLVDCCQKLLSTAKQDGENALASFWPADLEQHQAYLNYRETGKPGHLIKELEERLSWEVAMEYGYSARVGRTLEKTGCSTVGLPQDALHKVAEILAQDIQEKKVVTARRATVKDLTHFLSAFLHRLRVRGAVHHPLLRMFIAADGNSFLLNKKKNPLISPFPMGTRLPKFLHSNSSHDIFDIYRGSSPHWYRDWASRCLGVSTNDQGVPELFRQAILRLKEAKLLQSLPSGKGEAYGLPAEALTITSKVDAVQCPQCQQHTHLAQEEASTWRGQRCPRYRCEGVLVQAEVKQAYYSRIYRSGHTTRVNAHEHTGLLERSNREAVETAFKVGGPGDPNLLVCTPTLELGVDVGDLSATMVCSVPPGPANFVQRMGRAGRSTGNAFCLSVAINRPHDLYFYTQPNKMMRGEVRPPSCFLNAPEMLKRQMAAFALDSWAREETETMAIPRHASLVLGTGRAKFPGRAMEHYRQNKAVLTQQFLSLFAEHLDEENRLNLEEFGLSDRIPVWLDEAFEDLKKNRDQLKSQADKVNRRLQQIETDPSLVEDPELEKQDLDESMRVLRRLRSELEKKYPLNVLTDHGVLPNYAFPEPGVTLRSVVKVKDDGPAKDKYQTKEYLRAASSAIKEFAPFNKFYADGRQVRIKQIDIGSKQHPLMEKWRFCADCNYMEMVDTTKAAKECPRCQSTTFCDSGQERNLIPFRRASAFSRPLDTIAVDETDDRELKSYHTINLVDIAPENEAQAFAIENQGFGYQLLRQVTLREVNFGITATNQGDFHVAGFKVNEDGFVVCEECGACEEKLQNKQVRIDHSAFCKYRKGTFKQKTVPIMLYREVTSEAIRILLPSVTHQLDEARSSFKAALSLGLRRHFGGDPGHLIIRQVSEPSGLGDDQRRHYLVLYDSVPGGTGYLADLAKDQIFLDVLAQAQSELRACRCNTEVDADGCYRCLYAFQGSQELPHISRRKALELLDPLLKHREQLVARHTLGDLSQEVLLESELEATFLDALKSHCEQTEGFAWEESSHGGTCWKLTLATKKWRLEAQKKLSKADGVSTTTRPDFLLTNISGALDAPSVAVYCDGLAYHVCPQKPESRLRDDVEKRQAIVNSHGHIVWSLTWTDVEKFRAGKVAEGVSIFGKTKAKDLENISRKLGPSLAGTLHHRNALTQLLNFLEDPDTQLWARYAQALILTNTLVPPYLSTEQLHQMEISIQRGLKQEILPQPTLKKPEAMVGFIQQYQHLDFCAIVSQGAISRGTLESGRFYLRLDDSAASRIRQDYRQNWQNFLSTWNLLQFQDGLQVQCFDESLESTVVTQAPPVEVKLAETESEIELPESLEFADESCMDLLQKVLEIQVEIPINGFELVSAKNRVLAEAELAWPTQKVAVVLEDSDKQSFENEGWKVFLPEQEQEILEELNVE